MKKIYRNKRCSKGCSSVYCNPAYAMRRLALYHLYKEAECSMFPKTCSAWYKPYYGESPSFNINYILNHICRKPSC